MINIFSAPFCSNFGVYDEKFYKVHIKCFVDIIESMSDRFCPKQFKLLQEKFSSKEKLRSFLKSKDAAGELVIFKIIYKTNNSARPQLIEAIKNIFDDEMDFYWLLNQKNKNGASVIHKLTQSARNPVSVFEILVKVCNDKEILKKLLLLENAEGIPVIHCLVEDTLDVIGFLKVFDDIGYIKDILLSKNSKLNTVLFELVHTGSKLCVSDGVIDWFFRVLNNENTFINILFSENVCGKSNLMYEIFYVFSNDFKNYPICHKFFDGIKKISHEREVCKELLTFQGKGGCTLLHYIAINEKPLDVFKEIIPLFEIVTPQILARLLLVKDDSSQSVLDIMLRNCVTKTLGNLCVQFIDEIVVDKNMLFLFFELAYATQDSKTIRLLLERNELVDIQSIFEAELNRESADDSRLYYLLTECPAGSITVNLFVRLIQKKSLKINSENSIWEFKVVSDLLDKTSITSEHIEKMIVSSIDDSYLFIMVLQKLEGPLKPGLTDLVYKTYGDSQQGKLIYSLIEERYK